MAANAADGSTMIEARFADDGSLITEMMLLDPSWAFVQALAAPDLDDDGADRIAVLMRRSSDNLASILVFDVSQVPQVRQLLFDGAVSADWQAQALQLTEDGDGTSFGVLMTSQLDQSTHVIIADAMTGTTIRIADFSLPDHVYRHAYTSVRDVNSNDVSELAVVSERLSSRVHRLQLNDAGTGSSIRGVAIEFGREGGPIVRVGSSGGIIGPLDIGILLLLTMLTYAHGIRRSTSQRQMGQ
jgi:hypothetical protein